MIIRLFCIKSVGTVCRSSVTVSLNYSTEDRRGQALWVETDGLIPLKEEGQRTGAGVAAVGGIKRRDENLLGRIGLAEALGQGLRLLGGIAVGDAHRLVPGYRTRALYWSASFPMAWARRGLCRTGQCGRLGLP